MTETKSTLDFQYFYPVFMPITLADVVGYARRQGLPYLSSLDIPSLTLEIQKNRFNLQTNPQAFALYSEFN